MLRSGVFKIRPKGGGLVPFVPKRPQESLLRAIRKEIATGHRACIMILKARQIGFSTLIALLYLALALIREGCECLVAADKGDNQAKIWRIYRRAYRNLPDELRYYEDPVTGEKKDKHRFDSKKELEFSDNESHIGVYVATEGGLGTSDSISLAHFSEFALWKEQKETLKVAMDAMPDLPGCIAVIETTARGWGNTFHEMWRRSSAAVEEGRFTTWIPFFMPWWRERDYVRTPEPNFTLDDSETKLVRDVEAYADNYTLTHKQLMWRRMKLEEAEGDERLFNRENPSTPEHAFQATGDRVFDPEGLSWQVNKYVTEPRTFEIDLSANGDVSLYPVTEQFDVRGVPTNGRLRIYRDPAGRDCIMAADPTHNMSENSDSAAAHVIDVHTLEQLAVWEGRCDQHQFGDILFALGSYYNRAYAIVETNIGLTTAERLVELGYGNIHWYQPPGIMGSEPTWYPGYRTTPKGRDLAIHITKRLISERMPVLYDMRTLEELTAFQETQSGRKFKAEAPGGKQDNLVMALAIAYHIGNAKYGWTQDGKLLRQRKFDPLEMKKQPAPRLTAAQFAAKLRRDRQREANRRAFDCT